MDYTSLGSTIMPNIKNAKPAKLDKPTPEFPLVAHNSGQWAVKINGTMRYFGTWADPQAALVRYNNEYNALKAGKQPRTSAPGQVTIRDLANGFLTAKARQRDAGELTEKSWGDYKRTCLKVTAAFGFIAWRPISSCRTSAHSDLLRIVPVDWFS